MLRSVILALAFATPVAALFGASKSKACDEDDFDPGICCGMLDMGDCKSNMACVYDGVRGVCEGRPTVCQSISCQQMLQCPMHFKKVKKEGACCPICEPQDSFYKLKNDPSLSKKVRTIYKYGAKAKAQQGELPPINGINR
eukprot:gnl/MRDRNA2_/MRDRNA2_89209_c0_seq1.p1 gnl/MRDRNA2_/MRDRNA2_89209_c0~~gnl/MRDRNA2_/MRDRNA2_89209_c0_seq1.p1  ORF type:complete len:141 (-),score=31.69 gnl/MRDRNA2_/MRDRNA2_89209_c0_seq1:63-485(-)